MGMPGIFGGQYKSEEHRVTGFLMIPWGQCSVT